MHSVTTYTIPLEGHLDPSYSSETFFWLSKFFLKAAWFYSLVKFENIVYVEANCAIRFRCLYHRELVGICHF
jgi:hypothetical protein